VIEFSDVYTTPEATEILYDLLRERQYDPEVNISHTTLPSFADHRDFVERRPYWCWFLISDEEDWIGTVSVTMRNEIGIFIFRSHRGKGYGRKSLEKLLQDYKPQPPIFSERYAGWVANIAPNNEKSSRLFESLGFKLTQKTYHAEPRNTR